MKKDRLDELLTLRASGELSARQRTELEGLLREFPERGEADFEVAAAAIDIALHVEDEPLPGHLRKKVLADAQRHFSSEKRAHRSGGRRPVSFLAWGGWLAAAAVLLAAIGLRWFPLDGEPGMHRDAQAQRTQLLAEDPSARVVPWTPTDDPTSSSDATGDVVWSDSRQTGFLRIAGLQANDPGRFQYQVWIFDRGRDERYPVDGGVFDVEAGQTETVVAIRNRLRIGEPYLFAVTVERPGGVVVSDRSRIALLAQVGG